MGYPEAFNREYTRNAEVLRSYLVKIDLNPNIFRKGKNDFIYNEFYFYILKVLNF